MNYLNYQKITVSCVHPEERSRDIERRDQTKAREKPTKTNINSIALYLASGLSGSYEKYDINSKTFVQPHPMAFQVLACTISPLGWLCLFLSVFSGCFMFLAFLAYRDFLLYLC